MTTCHSALQKFATKQSWPSNVWVQRGSGSGLVLRVKKHRVSCAIHDEIGSNLNRLCFRDSQCGRLASFSTDAPLYEASGCEERGEGLQGWLHCVSRRRGEGCSRNEHSVPEDGYVSGFHGLLRHD